jgi:hypothetical protein
MPRVSEKAKWAARLKARSCDPAAYSRKKKIQAACVVPRWATVMGSAASMNTIGRKAIIRPKGIFIPKVFTARKWMNSDTRNIGARNKTNWT